MKPVPIRILLIEDNPGDARLIGLLLEEAGIELELELDHAADLASGLARLTGERFDAVLLDLTLPDSRGLDTFTATFAAAAGVPIVVLSGLADEKLAVEAVHAGAQDYLVKGQVDGSLLGRSLRYAIERKRFQDALQESNARFRTVYEESPVGMVIFDADRRISQANGAFCAMVGYSEDELRGRSPLELTHEEDLAECRGNLSRLLGGEVKSTRRESRYVTRSGRTIWTNVTASTVRDASGGFLYGVALVEDITARREADERLRRHEELLSEAQQIAHLGSWEWDVVENRVTWSEELYRIYGLDPERHPATFEAYLALVHPEDRDAVRGRIEQALGDQAPFSFDERIVRPDGTVRTLHSRGEVLADQAGRVARLVGACQDVTERKQQELELERARDSALRSARLKSAFLANMSHEIRTPLNIILGYASVIASGQGPTAPEPDVALLQGIERAAERLMITIDGILDISKMETGNFDVRPQQLHLRGLLERQLDDFRMLAAEKKLSLELEVEQPDAVVRFDEYCLSHALMNLLQNAIKFTREGGVSVRLWRDEEGSLCLDVSDTGIGIDPAYLPHLFEPFSQEDFGYTRRFEGSGLGLTLVREYLERNGATISVRSRKGAGSLFRIHFPRESENAEAAAEVPPKPVASELPSIVRRRLERPVVLVVEDDPDTQRYMEQLLDPRYRVILAASGAEARRQLEQHPVLLVLMDLSLRGEEDGLMLTAALRRTESWKHIPVIATTAHAFPEDRSRALESGCDAYLAKPIRQAVLLSLMEELIEPAGSTPSGESLH